VTLPAGAQIGKYIVRGKLAEGGMAEIYLATSQGAEGFEKEVVIKRVRSFLASDPGFVDMFIAEARLASRLNHANVVQIFDFAKHEDTYYLAMEYVRGCALSALLRKCRELCEPVPPVLVAHIGAEVARGLHYAHRLKVNGEPLFLVHRDVTPQNVLISFDGAVKLTDFGIAKAGNKLTSPGMLKGKFAYMSPEQSRGEAVDARTDVFALGIILWEMLSGGARLFDGDSELAVLREVQQHTIQPPTQTNPIPPELVAVVMKALERDLDARYQTAGELERALVQCVLNHALSPDDTDVANFVRRVYIGGVPSAMALPAVPERKQKLANTPKPADASESTASQPKALMSGPRGRKGSTSGGGEGSRAELSPDEDVNASTHQLPQREQSAGDKKMPPPRVTPPGRPIPAAQGRTATPAAPVPAASSEQGADQSQRPTDLALPAITGSGQGNRGGESSNSEAEPPPYEPTVTLPAPAPVMAPAATPAPVAASGREGSSRRLVLGAGAVLLALVAAAGIGSFSRSPKDAPAPVLGESQGPGPIATAPAPRVADAGTAAEGGALAMAPTPAASAPGPGTGETTGKASPSEQGTPAPAKGTLAVRAMPYATVLLDGRKLGEVQGRRTFKVDPGTYELKFDHPTNPKSERITIEPNGTVMREFRAR
jgi:serine/threonine protein kinase